MYLLVLGLVLLVMKYFSLGPVANWDWWVTLAPFALAIVWWWVADLSGWTRRKIEQKEEQRKLDHLNTGRKRMGLPPVNNTKR